MTAPLPWTGPIFEADALCAEIGGDYFFPDAGESNAVAKWLCGRCENETACLEWALDNEEPYGIFGGKSANERRKILRQRAKDKRPRGGQFKPIRHGTEAGMRAHQRRGDVVPADDPCGCRRAANLAAVERRERGVA